MKFTPLNAQVKYENLEAVFTAIEKLYNQTFVNMTIPEKIRKLLAELNTLQEELKKTMEV